MSWCREFATFLLFVMTLLPAALSFRGPTLSGFLIIVFVISAYIGHVQALINGTRSRARNTILYFVAMVLGIVFIAPTADDSLSLRNGYVLSVCLRCLLGSGDLWERENLRIFIFFTTTTVFLSHVVLGLRRTNHAFHTVTSTRSNLPRYGEQYDSGMYRSYI